MNSTFSHFGTALLVAGLALCSAPAHAQDPNNGSSSDPKAAPATPAPADKKKLKKVWTNDEIGSVGGQISVVGTQDQSQAKTDQPAAKKASDASADSDAHQKQVDRYKDQMKQYQAQIDAADKQIDKLKNFKAENTAPSGGIAPTQAYTMTPPEDQMKQLEEKKKELQAKMDDTEQEARRNGVSRDELR